VVLASAHDQSLLDLAQPLPEEVVDRQRSGPKGDEVGCDGGPDPAAGHPLVYLTVDATGKVDCPYCGRRYIRRAGARADAGH